MEGMYLPGFYRSRIVNEVRNTHFEMGHSKPEFSTTNSKTFKGLPGGRTQITSSQNKSHVPLTLDTKDPQTSEFSSKFRSFTEESRISPIKPTPSLKVGNSSGTYVTTSSKTYQKHEGIEKFISSGASNLRKHNFELGVKERQNHPSDLQKEHHSKSGPNAAATDKQIKEKYTKIPEFSEKSSNFLPTTFQDFKEQRAEHVETFKKQLVETHINYPDQIKDLSTTAQVFFSPKRLESTSLPKHKLKDLKSSHLNFGSSPSNYVLSSVHAVPDVKPVKIVKCSVSPSSIQFGEDKGRVASDYCWNFADRPKSELRAKVDKKYENFSYVVLGDEQQKMTTENQLSFKNKALSQSPTRLPRDTERSLRSHHFHLGNEKKHEKKTTASDYSPPGKVEKWGNPKESQAKMNESHWEFGKYPTQVHSEVQKEFNKKSSKREVLNKSELRKSHFQIGDSKSTWKSHYNSNYSWIQPVPDTNYKISLMK
jgi:hypothetical protein